MKDSPRNRNAGFEFIEMLVVLAILLVAAVVLLSTLARSRRPAPGITCSNNLKQIDLSFKTWALDNNDRFPMEVSITNGGTKELVNTGAVYVHFLVMSNELSTPKLLVCPEAKHLLPREAFWTAPALWRFSPRL
ncbi:MAG TPA: type II secretion system protein [Verrucomicrobiae bacterium]|nr:type II secretion system protein [Verrucomicrobiae bacterium]